MVVVILLGKRRTDVSAMIQGGPVETSIEKPSVGAKVDLEAPAPGLSAGGKKQSSRILRIPFFNKKPGAKPELEVSATCWKG